MPNQTPSDEFEGVFGGIATPAECILLIDKLCGRAIAWFAAENINPERRSLRDMARALKRGGQIELAAMVREVPMTTPVPKPTFLDFVKRRQRRFCRPLNLHLSSLQNYDFLAERTDFRPDNQIGS